MTDRELSAAAVAAGQAARTRRERRYLGWYEVEREYDAAGTSVDVERQSVMMKMIDPRPGAPDDDDAEGPESSASAGLSGPRAPATPAETLVIIETATIGPDAAYRMPTSLQSHGGLSPVLWPTSHSTRPGSRRSPSSRERC